MNNIKSRVSKGKSIISEIFNILDNICFGPHYFEIAMLLRRSMLLSSITYNSGVWYNVSSKEIKELSTIDQIFFSRLCKTPQTASFTSYFLEFGEYEVEIHIKMKRIMYFFNLVNRCKSNSVYIFFMTQFSQRNSKDWVTQALRDFEDVGIDSSFEFLESISLASFRKLVKKEIDNLHSKLS